MPRNADLGRAIRGLRHEQKLTLEGLAFAAGIHLTTLSLIERAKRSPSWETLCRIANGLQITVAELAQQAESAARVQRGYERVLAEERARSSRPSKR